MTTLVLMHSGLYVGNQRVGSIMQDNPCYVRADVMPTISDLTGASEDEIWRKIVAKVKAGEVHLVTNSSNTLITDASNR